MMSDVVSVRRGNATLVMTTNREKSGWLIYIPQHSCEHAQCYVIVTSTPETKSHYITETCVPNDI